MRKILIHISLIGILFFSCNNRTSDSKENNKDLSENSFSEKPNLNQKENNSVRFMKGKSVVFFSVSKQEYIEFINRMGADTKWEFDIIYTNFKKTAENAQRSIEANGIKSLYTSDKIIGLINMNNDTMYFNRLSDDYFVGQLFFDGRDSLLIKEGLYKSNDLEELIKDFFKISGDFNISNVPEMSDSFRYYSPDTSVININDSI